MTRAADSLELARKLDKAFAEQRTRVLHLRLHAVDLEAVAPGADGQPPDRPDYGRDVWPALLELLDGAATLEAVLAALLFRDRLMADEGLHHAGGFMDALVTVVCDDDFTSEDAARLSEPSQREVWDNPDDAEYDDVEGGDDV